LEDLNTVLPDQSEGAPGQRLRAITTEDERTRDRSFLFGTAPAQPSAQAAGHLLRYHPRSREYEHLAALDAGWSVARLTRHGVEPVVLLARHADGQRHRLYRIVEDKLEPLNVEGGAELANYYHSYNGLIYYQ